MLKDWPIWLILLTPFVLTIYYWDQIPEKIAMHWNAAGEVDDWGEKGWEAFLLPAISVGVYLLLVVVPYIDPKRKTDNEQKALKAFRYVMPLFFSALSVVILFQWLGSNVKPTNVVYLSMCVFFLILGNYMQTIKPNYFIGIRTPWTLESEDNWRKTHRFGGRLWVAVSLIMLVCWFILPESILITAFVAGLLSMTAVIIGYSFYLFTQEKKGTETQPAGEEETAS